MPFSYQTARAAEPSPEALLRRQFGSLCGPVCQATFLDSTQTRVFGLTGLKKAAPVTVRLMARPEVGRFLDRAGDGSLLLVWSPGDQTVAGFVDLGTGCPRAVTLDAGLAEAVVRVCGEAETWAGILDATGRHHLDPHHPGPGPHFAVNLLVGDRIGFPHPLQTTPKSVIDHLGRGSFRSHAATQVLATRWDLCQEENGFPANRQFYLTENGNPIFYSAEVRDMTEATCVHDVNRTVLTAGTGCGLGVRREFHLAAQEEGLPLACEIQKITLINRGVRSRRLRLVTTGMFGSAAPGAQMEDVLYSNIILQAGMVRNEVGEVLALAPDYHPERDRSDLRFHSLVLCQGKARRLPREFCTDYREFLGHGTLERPEGLARLSNRLSRKGPGFFALAHSFDLEPGAEVCLLSFTGLVSSRGTPDFGPDSLGRQVGALLARYPGPDTVDQAAAERARKHERHAAFFQIRTGQTNFDSWVNRLLPYQVFYQSFVSRSFCQTQKGYREIGFREVQDLFASMGPFLAEGKQALVEDLLGQWASQIHEFGFANHNFYWEGKEPGLWSDDALWLFQAIERYVTLTGSTAILDREFAVAGGSGARRRLYDTLKAVLRYSGRISVGRHGLPLLDRADWNDCLKVDRTFPDGTQKQDLWTRRQEADPGASERSLDTDGTESVMNAFLLKRAADILAGLARTRKDGAGASWAEAIGRDMVAACRHHAWKGSWYARLLVNRPSSYPVVGAPGDGLSTDETDGSLFLNSFSWAVLAGVAGDAEIAAMYPLLESRLKTPHGYRLVTAHDLRRVEPTVASAEYFPGDRENGAVFKHASLMAVAALLKGASEVKDPVLARNLAASAWSMIDLAAPGRTLSDPFVLAGNPRFCTQYNNSETGENIGPLLSGTASWASLALRQAFGVDLRTDVLVLDPILRESQSSAEVEVRWQDEFYRIRYTKPEGFVRAKDQQPEVRVDGRPLDGLVIPRLGGPGTRDIEVRWS